MNSKQFVTVSLLDNPKTIRQQFLTKLNTRIQTRPIADLQVTQQ